MATLIDRDKCQERIRRFADRLVDWGFPKEAEAVRAVAKGIKLEKTVDAVEVVRCKDCKHYHTYNRSAKYDCKEPYCCRSAIKRVGPEDFCSFGEKRTDGKAD